MCYNDKAMRGNPKVVKKKVLRNQKKFLTNSPKCDIMITQLRETQPRPQKEFQKNSKKGLDKSQKM
jgi:hypothetical protein